MWKKSITNVWKSEKIFSLQIGTLEILLIIECDGHTELLWRTYASEKYIDCVRFIYQMLIEITEHNETSNFWTCVW